jgi:hypothetical protein
MENATFISQLHNQSAHDNNSIEDNDNDRRKEPVKMVSYSDVLKSMTEDNSIPVQEHTIMPQQISHSKPIEDQTNEGMYEQAYEHRPMQYNNSRVVTNNNVRERDTRGEVVGVNVIANDTMNTFQNEMLILLAIYIILHTPHVQQIIKSKIPGIVNESTGATGVVGTVINGVLLIVLWNVSKRIVTKYMKDL